LSPSQAAAQPKRNSKKGKRSMDEGEEPLLNQFEAGQGRPIVEEENKG